MAIGGATSMADHAGVAVGGHAASTPADRRRGRRTPPRSSAARGANAPAPDTTAAYTCVVVGVGGARLQRDVHRVAVARPGPTSSPRRCRDRTGTGARKCRGRADRRRTSTACRCRGGRRCRRSPRATGLARRRVRGGDRHVVEQAEAHRPMAFGVMPRWADQRHGRFPCCQRMVRRLHCGAGSQARNVNRLGGRERIRVQRDGTTAVSMRASRYSAACTRTARRAWPIEARSAGHLVPASGPRLHRRRGRARDARDGPAA